MTPTSARDSENAVERALGTARARVLTEEDFAFLRHELKPANGWVIRDNMTLDEIERQAISATLRRTGGNINEAAASLHIDRSTLYDRLKKYSNAR